MIDEHALWRPGDRLRPYVAWCVGYRQAGAPPIAHRGLPSPWLTMIVTLDEPLVIARHPDPRQPASTHDFLLGGLHTAPALVTHDGSQSGIQLALTPLGARALLGMPAAELASIDVEAADVLGRLADEVRERVLDAPDWGGRFACLKGSSPAACGQRTGQADCCPDRRSASRGTGCGSHMARWPATSATWRAARRARCSPKSSETSKLHCRATGNDDAMSETKTPPPPNVWPSLRANDAHGLIKFLTGALGFEATVVYAEGDIVHHAELAWPPGGGVMLGSARPGDPHGITRPGNLSAYVVTDAPDALCARAMAHGAKVIQELYDTDYGSRDFAVEDPEGNRWTFGTYPGAPR